MNNEKNPSSLNDLSNQELEAITELGECGNKTEDRQSNSSELIQNDQEINVLGHKEEKKNELDWYVGKFAMPPVIKEAVKEKKFVSTISNQKRKNRIGYIFLSPWIIGTILFGLIPLIMTIVMSFAQTRWGSDGAELFFFNHYGDGSPRNILINYISILRQSSNLLLFLDFIKIELIYVPVIIVLAFILAIILTKGIRFKGIFRTIFFLPVIIMSGTLVTIILGLGETVNIDTGQVEETGGSTLTQSFLFRIIANYSEPAARIIGEIFSNFIVILWLTGIPIILFMNAINKINKDLYEAAKIDGANPWQMMWKVTIPNCMYTAFIISVFSIVQISVLPISPIYTEQITTGLQDIATAESTLGHLSAYTIYYLILIVLLIGLFALIFIPRQHKAKEVLTYTQIEQLKDTKKRHKHLADPKKGGN